MDTGECVIVVSLLGVLAFLGFLVFMKMSPSQAGYVNMPDQLKGINYVRR